jgi:hypothetical protein
MRKNSVSALQPRDYFFPESPTVYYLGDLIQALCVAHGLTISETAWERYTNKQGF